MGTSDGDLSFFGHKGSQHLGPGENRQTGGLSGPQFGIVEADGRGDNYYFGTRNIIRGMALEEFHPQMLQFFGQGIGRQVGTTDSKALADEQFSQTADADTAYADEMIMFHGEFRVWILSFTFRILS